MLELITLFSLKSYAIVIAVSVIGGGVAGFLFGHKVQAAALAEAAKASAAISGAASSIAKKL